MSRRKVVPKGDILAPLREVTESRKVQKVTKWQKVTKVVVLAGIGLSQNTDPG